MRVRITGRPHGVVDGIDFGRFVRGLTYDVATVTANVLLAERWAEPVDDSESVEPALVIPVSHLDRVKVLVVEDDADFCEIVSQALRQHGVDVVTAADGAEGLAALQRHRPALIVLDLNLPRVSGRDFLDSQHKLTDEKLANVPVIVVSARDDAIEQGREVGATEVLQKPVELDYLVSQIARRLHPRTTR